MKKLTKFCIVNVAVLIFAEVKVHKIALYVERYSLVH